MQLAPPTRTVVRFVSASLCALLLLAGRANAGDPDRYFADAAQDPRRPASHLLPLPQIIAFPPTNEPRLSRLPAVETPAAPVLAPPTGASWPPEYPHYGRGNAGREYAGEGFRQRLARLPAIDGLQPNTPAEKKEDTQVNAGSNASSQAGNGAAGGNGDKANGDGAEKKPLGEPPPEDASQFFLRQSSVLLKPGEGQWDIGTVYSFDEVLLPTVFANNALGVDRLRTRQYVVPLSVRYAVKEKMEVFGQIPVGGAVFEQSSFERDETESRAGLGDLSGGVKYLLNEQKDGWPDVIGALSFSAPTGVAPFRTNSPLGSGFWSASADLNFIKSYDPLVFFAGAGYTHQFAEEVRNQIIQPGEMLRYSLGLGFAVNDDLVLSAQFQGQFQMYTYVSDVRLPSSIQEPMSLRFAITRVVSKCEFFEPFVTFGLTSDATDVQIGASWTRAFGKAREKQEATTTNESTPKK